MKTCGKSSTDEGLIRTHGLNDLSLEEEGMNKTVINTWLRWIKSISIDDIYIPHSWRRGSEPILSKLVFRGGGRKQYQRVGGVPVLVLWC